MGKMIAASGIGLMALSAAACGTTHTVDVTKTVPGPAVTVTVPGPTVTVTITKTAQPPVLMTKTFSGSGQWNSPEFTLSCQTPAVKVTYSYSGNDLGGSASNFMADIQTPGTGDDQQIANTIASSGGTTTTVYPDTSVAGSRYYLSVQADGSWSFTLSETC